jgi:sigma-B regulation protein RsbU (phosphoserine phosphatase)
LDIHLVIKDISERIFRIKEKNILISSHLHHLNIVIMTSSQPHGFFGDYLTLFAACEVYIYVFMEIVTKIHVVEQVIFKRATNRDYIGFVIIFGLFSIFGTYIGIPVEDGVISNIRDLSPMISGLVGGPYVGFIVGLIGGVHRFSLGGETAVTCLIATVLAGLFAGILYHLNKGKLPGIIPAMAFAAAFEIFHGFIGMIMVQPLSEGIELFFRVTPSMVIANALGLAISIIIVNSKIELESFLHSEVQENREIES